MNTPFLTPAAEVDFWLRVLHPGRDLSPAVAKILVDLKMPSDEVARMRDLSAKARAGTLTPEETREMEQAGRAGAMMSILQSKARMALRRESAELTPA